MEKLDIKKLTATLRSGNIDSLKKVKEKISDEGNNLVTVQSNINVIEEDGFLALSYEITPNSAASVACTLATISIGDNTLGSSLSAQTGEVSTSEANPYVGWLIVDYQPSGDKAVQVNLLGTVRSASGDSTFNITETLGIG